MSRERVCLREVCRKPSLKSDEIKALAAVIEAQLPRWQYSRAYVLYDSDLRYFEPPLDACAIYIYSLPQNVDSRISTITFDLVRSTSKQVVKQELSVLVPTSAISHGEVLRVRDIITAIAIDHRIYITLDLFGAQVPVAIATAILRGILRRISTIPATGLEATRENIKQQAAAIDAIFTPTDNPLRWRSEKLLRQVTSNRGKLMLPKRWLALIDSHLDTPFLKERLAEKVFVDLQRLCNHPGIESLRCRARGTLKLYTKPITVVYRDLYYMLGRYEILIDNWELVAVRACDHFQVVDSIGISHPRILDGRLWTDSLWPPIEEALIHSELFLAVELILEALRTVDEEVIITPDVFWRGLTAEEFAQTYPHIDLETLWPK
ncbi:MAG: hypothetical protein QXT73_02355 [Candidatus Methanomethylicaceae archaeon]